MKIALAVCLLLLAVWPAWADPRLDNPVSRASLHALPIVDVRDAPYGAKCDGVVTASDGAITQGQSSFTSTAITFTAADVEKYISVYGAGSTSRLLSGVTATAGTAYAPGDTASDGTSTWIVATTKVVSATVAAGGSGGTDGTQTVTGTTGAGTKFQASVTVSGGAITAVLSISVAGSYAQNPKTLTAEPVTGAGLTGAQLNVVMGVNTLAVEVPGVYSGTLPGTLTQTSTSGGGTGLTVMPTFGVNPLVTTIASISGHTANLNATAGATVTNATWEYGTKDGAAINAATSALSTTGGTIEFPPLTCLVDQTVIAYSNETLAGDNSGTSIVHATSDIVGPLFESYNAAALFGSGSNGGVADLVLKDIRFDGNAPDAPTLTDTCDFYGYRPTFQNLICMNANQFAIRSEYGTGSPSDGLGSMEGTWRRVTARQSPGYGTTTINFNGPHDSRWQDVLAINAGIGSEHVYVGPNAGGLMVANSHSWSSGSTSTPPYGWIDDGIDLMLANTTAEGVSVANIKTRANGLTVSGGAYYINPQTTNKINCFQIGDSTASKPASYATIRTTINDCEGGIVNFDDDSGYADIIATGGAKDASTPLFVGTPATTSNFNFRLFNGATSPLEVLTGTLGLGSFGSVTPAGQLHVFNGASGVPSADYATAINLECNAACAFKMLGPNTAGSDPSIRWSIPLSNNDAGIYYNDNASGVATRSLEFRTSGNIPRFVMDNNGGIDQIYANDGTTGTTLNKLAKLTGANAVITATTDTDGAIGIVAAGAGTTGSAGIAILGQAFCVFDGATTAGDWVTYSSTTAGDCHDTGSTTRPAANAGIGKVLSSNGAGGTYLVKLDIP